MHHNYHGWEKLSFCSACGRTIIENKYFPTMSPEKTGFCLDTAGACLEFMKAQAATLLNIWAFSVFETRRSEEKEAKNSDAFRKRSIWRKQRLEIVTSFARVLSSSRANSPSMAHYCFISMLHTGDKKNFHELFTLSSSVIICSLRWLTFQCIKRRKKSYQNSILQLVRDNKSSLRLVWWWINEDCLLLLS
jgi:hypothetical protein